MYKCYTVTFLAIWPRHFKGFDCQKLFPKSTLNTFPLLKKIYLSTFFSFQIFCYTLRDMTNRAFLTDMSLNVLFSNISYNYD